MASLKPRLRSTRNVGLTGQEFAAWEEVATRPMQRTISSEHRDRLIAAGYIREVVDHSGTINALAMTGRGLRRLDRGK